MEKKGSPDYSYLAITPEDARRRLEHMGFVEDMWEKILEQGFFGHSFGSHETRALITIAKGNKPQILGDVYRKIRKAAGLPPERPKPFT
jgi:hypothetical protein